MIIYEGTKRNFSQDILNGTISEKLKTVFQEFGITGGGIAEVRSWENSLSRMDIVLSDPGIPEDSEVAIEYQIPTTAKRIDFMIAGKDEQGEDNVFVIELKQWEEAEITSLDGCVKAFTGGKERVVQHPCAQVYAYARLLENVNEEVQTRRIHLRPTAYLHNFKEANRHQLEDDFYSFYLHEVPLYLANDGGKLREAIKAKIHSKPTDRLFDIIDHGKLKPSKALQDAIPSLLAGNQEFVMIDEQQVAYATIMKLVRDCLKTNRKHTILVQGGPGTGKSVIAVTALAEIIRQGFSCAYVTKNSAPRNVFSKLLVQSNQKLSYVKGLFKGSGSFVDTKANKNRYDCLLVDEAHRLNDKSGMFRNQGENQIKEIINAARVSVFFLDEDQIIHVNDIGTKAEVQRWAKEEGSILVSNENLRLTSQFRCNGSDAYIAWLDNALQIHPTAHRLLDLDYDFRIYDSVAKMREDLRQFNEVSNKARMVAGYCYDWASKSNPNEFDIFLPEFRAQWNFNSTGTWAIDKDSFDQVGCIHTCQGLEFDYVGVIIGRDLSVKDGRVVTDITKRSSNDASIHGLKKRPNSFELGDRIIRNTYKTLMTRGQKGCFVYCEDKALAKHLRKLLKR